MNTEILGKLKIWWKLGKMKQNVRFLELYYEHTQVGELCKSELLEVIRIDILSAPIQRTECCQNYLYSRTFTDGQLSSTTAPVFGFLDSGQCFVSIPFLGAADGPYVHSYFDLSTTTTSPQRQRRADSKLHPRDTVFLCFVVVPLRCKSHVVYKFSCPWWPIDVYWRNL